MLLTPLFIAIPVLVIAVLTPLNIIANNRFNLTFNAFRALDRELSRAVASTESGVSFESGVSGQP